MDTTTTIYKPHIHEHPLSYSARFTIDGSYSHRCSGCRTTDNMYGVYFCNKFGCSIWLHKECTEAPLEINHPSHPQHPLMLNNYDDSSDRCVLCRGHLPPLRYTCFTCKITVDIACGMKPWPQVIEHPLCHSHPLIVKGNEVSASCGVCKESNYGLFYLCIECNVYFHLECVRFSQEVNHPCHSNHPLKLTAFDAFTDDAEKTCILCGNYPRNVCYHCFICDFTSCLRCTRRPPPLVVEDMKTHQHQLIRISKRILYACDFCGLKRDTKYYHGSYICHQCDFVVHGMCIGLPRVISINRHDHRISFTYHIGPDYSKCGVCHQSISQYHGAYSCLVCPNYAVHSRCAIERDVWDGVELEGIPYVTEDMTPYKVVSDGLISHVSHVEHPLKLHKGNILYDHEWIRCEACRDPVGFDSVFVCEKCCFLLHQKCANLPMKKKFIVDTELYKLEVDNLRVASYCSECATLSDGFKYSSHDENRKVDVRCFSLSEPFVHAGHSHLLYFRKAYYRNSICDACMKMSNSRFTLACEDCRFNLCFFCATLPLRTWHRTDEHPLILCCDKKAGGQSWCDICERKLNPMLWFYTCSSCEVAIHAKCVIGDISRINPGSTIEFGGPELGWRNKIFEAVPNNQSTRPLCTKCHSRCKFSIFLKEKNKASRYFCSSNCVYYYFN
ncbi:unnamed protein product [Brassica oleracea]